MRRIRNIINIDEEKCNGCGKCILACAEGALALVNGKAKLIGELYCDGAGACLGHCPTGAMTIEQREADDYDARAVAAHTAQTPAAAQSSTVYENPVRKASPAVMHHGGCPGAAQRNLTPPAMSVNPAGSAATAPAASWLGNWPVQLHLVPVTAPHYQGAKLLLCADCVPFAHPGFHQEMLAGRTLIIGCPKLDDNEQYLEKLSRIISSNDIASVEVVFMEVPCCFGMVALARQAISASGKDLPASAVKVGINGDVQGRIDLANLPW